MNCIRCENLFYLVHSACLDLRESTPMCQANDGVSKICRKCSFSGWKLTAEGTCEHILFCDISNGINTCIACNEGYAVNLVGECVTIEKKIDNCEIYFMQSKEGESIGKLIG